ncbi:hypothetical protein ACFQ0T_11605 [Kitasatospora gansuensis]
MLAAGLAGRPFRLTDLQGSFQPAPFDPGQLGRPVPMPDQNWYLIPPLTGVQALNPAARRQYDEQAAHARARFEHDWHAAQSAEQERLRRLADYRAQYDAWAAEHHRLAADRAGQEPGWRPSWRAGAPVRWPSCSRPRCRAGRTGRRTSRAAARSAGTRRPGSWWWTGSCPASRWSRR